MYCASVQRTALWYGLEVTRGLSSEVSPPGVRLAIGMARRPFGPLARLDLGSLPRSRLAKKGGQVGLSLIFSPPDALSEFRGVALVLRLILHSCILETLILRLDS